MKIPPLTLTLSQVTWALSLGQIPSKDTLDKLNYLRQLGIPFEPGQRLSGSGNRVHYSYIDMVEMGLGLWALARGVKPRVISRFLVNQRKALHSLYVLALSNQPDAALHEPWVKNPGKSGVINVHSIYLHIHNLFDKKPCTFDVLDQASVNTLIAEILDITNVSGARSPTVIMPLTTLALQWLAWALEAPVVPPGRKSIRLKTE